jgi:hypothetical protein
MSVSSAAWRFAAPLVSRSPSRSPTACWPAASEAMVEVSSGLSARMTGSSALAWPGASRTALATRCAAVAVILGALR